MSDRDTSEGASTFAVFQARIEERLDSLLADEGERWAQVDPDLRQGFELLRSFIARGGKRLRPAFAFWAFIGCGGDPRDERIVSLGAALEMLHTFALVHDDVMDGSALRRHHPTVHRIFEGDHQRNGWLGESRRFGEGMAVLLGDLAFVYADRLAAPLPEPVSALLHQMKLELHVGQYLDLLTAAQSEQTAERAANVVCYKTAKYSVERPLHLGAALAAFPAGATGEARSSSLSAYGLAVGEAFQLRDDVLGAFGDPLRTGKNTGDDFRDGKQTLLIVLATTWAGGQCEPRGRQLLSRLGQADLTADEVASLQALLDTSGARVHVEARIAELTSAACEALSGASMHPLAAQELELLARRAAWRAT